MQFMRMLVGQNGSRAMRGGNYLRIECVKLLYEALNVKVMSDMDIQSFFLLLKKASEEMGRPVAEVREG